MPLRLIVIVFIWVGYLATYGGSAAQASTGTTGTYWVSTAGSDSNPCTQQSPCRSLNHVLEKHATDGSAVFVMPGVYREQVLITQSDLTIEGVGSGVYFYGSIQPDLQEASGRYRASWSWGESFSSTDFCTRQVDRVGLPRAACTTRGFWQAALRLEPVYTLQEVTPGTFYYDEAAQEVWLLPFPGGDPDDIEGLAFPYVMRLTEGTQHVTLRNVTIAYGASKPDAGILRIEGKGHVLDHVGVHHSAGTGILVYGADQVVMDHVDVSGHGQNGWRVTASVNYKAANGLEIYDTTDDLVIRFGSSTSNGWKGFDNCWFGGSTKFSFTNRLVIDRFYSADNKGFGIWLDIHNRDFLVGNSLSARDLGNGIFIEYISDDGIVEDNVVFGTRKAQGIGCSQGTGIVVSDSRNVVVRNNTIYGTEKEVRGVLQKTSCPTCRSTPHTSQDIHWENNLILEKRGPGIVRNLAEGSPAEIQFSRMFIEQQSTGDQALFQCIGNVSTCNASYFGITALPPAAYLADEASECGFQRKDPRVAGVGASLAAHPRHETVCTVNPPPDPDPPTPIPPEAAFSYVVTENQVQFTDESTDPASIVEHHWTFGDGASAVVPNPAHTYTEAGSYLVWLVVSNTFGLSDSTFKEISVTVPVSPPVVDFLARIDSSSVQFYDQSADDGEVMAWQWEFGDGASSDLPNPVHHYSDAGLYEVTLEVTDNHGLSATAVRDVMIAPPPSVSALVANFAVALDDYTASFHDLSTADTLLVAWKWQFGEGGVSTDRHPIYRYAASGDYDVTLTVYDAVGQAASTNQTVRINNQPLEERGPFVDFLGRFVFEAENFHERQSNARTGTVWEVTERGGADSTVRMVEALPDAGTLIRHNYNVGNARLSYHLAVTDPGAYYVWVRMASNEGARSVYLGTDSLGTRRGVTVPKHKKGWVWANQRQEHQRAVVVFETAGIHTFHLWMREDGVAIDRIVLTRNPNDEPDAQGPPESLRYAVSADGRGERPLLGVMLPATPPSSLAAYSYEVHPAYPNPARGHAWIPIVVPSPAEVHMSLFDLLGREVIASSPIEVAREGPMELGLDLSMLPAGVYLYRIEVDLGTEQRTNSGRLVRIR